MKVITEDSVQNRDEPVAVLFKRASLSGPALMFRKSPDKDSVIVFSDLTGDGGFDWDLQLNGAEILKFYYPGDRITIEV